MVVAPNSFSVVVVVTVTVNACGSIGTMTIPALALRLLVLLAEMLEEGCDTISGRLWDGWVVYWLLSDVAADRDVLVSWLCLLVSVDLC